MHLESAATEAAETELAKKVATAGEEKPKRKATRKRKTPAKKVAAKK